MNDLEDFSVYFSEETLVNYRIFKKHLPAQLNSIQILMLISGIPIREDVKFQKASFQNDKGWLYHELQDYEIAMKEYNKGIVIYLDYPLMLNNIELAHYSLHDFESAKQSYIDTIKNFPIFIKPYSNSGIAISDLKNDYQITEILLKIALHIDPKYGKALMYLNEEDKIKPQKLLIDFDTEFQKPNKNVYN